MSTLLKELAIPNNKIDSILFLCTGNSCRSQIAEGFAKTIFPDNIKIESAGTESHGINPYAIETMNEVNIDISNQVSTKIEMNDLYKFDLIITLCGDAYDKCPVLNANQKHQHWSLEDPAKYKGPSIEVKKKFAQIREQIHEKINILFNELSN